MQKELSSAPASKKWNLEANDFIKKSCQKRDKVNREQLDLVKEAIELLQQENSRQTIG